MADWKISGGSAISVIPLWHLVSEPARTDLSTFHLNSGVLESPTAVCRFHVFALSSDEQMCISYFKVSRVLSCHFFSPSY